MAGGMDVPKGLDLLVNDEHSGAQEFMRHRSIVVKGAGNAKTAFEYIVKYASGELDNKYILDNNAPCFSGSRGIVTISSSKYLYSNPVVAIKLFNLHSDYKREMHVYQLLVRTIE